ncbi:uncharacterized protein LOC119561739 isoform X4 [Drosophila subpulchrella]|nr:uncharacterized protein LOC119561739 isoform X4 [Drosophila subpulchrella]
MDAYDEARINKELSFLRGNSEFNTNFQNETLVRFEEINEHINREQVLISNFINSYQNKIFKEIDEEYKNIQLIQYIDRINFNIDLLFNHLNNIAESLLFAKLKLVPKYLLNSVELEKIKNVLSQQKIEVQLEHELYNVLSLESTTLNKTLIFHIKVPILSKESYNLYRLISLPLNKTMYVNLPNVIIKNDLEIKIIETPCIKVGGTHICETPLTPNNTECLHNLLDDKEATCSTTNRGHQPQIFVPLKGLMVILNVENLNITSNCISSRIFNGPMLIKYDNCSISANGTKYVEAATTIIDDIEINLPHVQNLTTIPTDEPLNLQALHLSNLENGLAVTNIEERTTTHLSIIYLLVALSILITAVAWTFNRKEIILSPTPADPIVTPTIPSLWPSFQAKGGGVTADVFLMTSPPPKPPRALSH